ncbi:MAG: hypothetical protein JWO09_969 [Bacteroidetes bacterium]|nr:hypothetical protein [Bacteroidota bacterium]
MEQTNIQAGATARPQFLTVLCILSYIGSGIWALLSLIGMVASGWILSLLGIGVAAAENSATMEGMDSVDAEQMHQATAAVGGLMGMGTTFFIIIFLVSLIFAGLSLFGVVKMWNLKKSGFIVYTIVNGLILILGLIGGGWVMGLISAAFIAMYAANLKYMS